MMEKSLGVLARALYSNQPESKNELGFRKGEILTVIEIDYEGQPGWWMCALRGNRGICPGNYLELLEDKYSVPKPNAKTVHERPESFLDSKSGAHPLGIDPHILETYDVPRSQTTESSTLTRRPSAIYCKNNVEEEENDDHTSKPFLPLSTTITKVSPLELYDVPKFELPTYGAIIGESLTRKRRQYGSSDAATATNPRLLPLPSLIIPSLSPGSSNSSSARSSSNSDSSNGSTGSNPNILNADLPPPPPRRKPSGRNFYRRTPSPPKTVNVVNSSILKTEPETTLPTNSLPLLYIDDDTPSSQNDVVLRRSRVVNNKSFRSSVRPESVESGIGMVSGLSPPMQELYDVPRSSSVAPPPNNPPSSRPPSSMSISSSGIGLSIANSDSKDSLDMYDVPRSVKSYVNHMETKYDQVSQQSHHLRHLSNSNASVNSASSTNVPAAGLTRSRNSSCHSSYSGYGYGHQPRGPGSVRSVHSDFGGGTNTSTLTGGSSMANLQRNQSIDELYDVPRSSSTRNVSSYRSSQGLGSMASISAASCTSIQTNSSSEADGGMTYDIPVSHPRKVMSLCDSTETLSCQENIDIEDATGDLHLELGASSSSLMSSASAPYRHHNERKLTTGSMGSVSHLVDNSVAGSGSSEVKILPLGPKAAVSVCEKLRQEVVKSIQSILDHTSKPKWRTKNVLTEILPEIRFSATRLNLAIKDLCDFCSRSLSNARKLGDEGILKKLHRLLTPLINASQIIQKDLDELEAYFWSVDRLSVAHSSNEKNTAPDALDQLVLCTRSLTHYVTEIANFLAFNSSALFKEGDRPQQSIANSAEKEGKDEPPEDYDYVSLFATNPDNDSGDVVDGAGNGKATNNRLQLDWRDQQLLEFYSVQIGVTAPLLSQSISTFISAIQKNEPPKVFNGHLKYVILLAYKMLFAGDTVHRNIIDTPLKLQIENKANELNKSIVALTEASKVATRDFPRMPPMQAIINQVYETRNVATQLKTVIFNATCALH